MDKVILWNESEYSFNAACGFIPNMRLYLHEDGKNRPCILVVPGGGYAVVSPSEGEIVAKKFYEMGYQTAVVTYTTNLLMSAPLKMQPMQDLMRAIRYVRKHAEELHADKDKIMLCGFSAGAHACGSVAVHWQEFEKSETGEYASVSAKPDAVILSYPVITSGEYAHRDSFTALLGADASREELEYMSLEKQVTEYMVPCFLWQTATDELVPVQNSFLFAQALQEKKIPYAFHVFSNGKHGLSLADETWANEEFGEPYTLEQTYTLGQAVMDGTFPVSDEVKRTLTEMTKLFNGQTEREREYMNSEVSQWPSLADEWIKSVLAFSSPKRDLSDCVEPALGYRGTEDDPKDQGTGGF